METEFKLTVFLIFPLSCICAEMEYSLCQVNWIVGGKKRIEGKHTVTTHVGRGSFLDSLANPGKAEGGGTTEKPVQYECYLACYHNKCKRTYMTEKVVLSNKENWSDSIFLFTVARTMVHSVKIKSVNSTQTERIATL